MNRSEFAHKRNQALFFGTIEKTIHFNLHCYFRTKIIHFHLSILTFDTFNQAEIQ
ncbi:hypothetical protein SAMN05444682_11682 [Parapedobacter indicus]|uniref:Uncharacterized protein n=1 Tax=Parapedobacter indicus TaxID=1477437 RepID=A0A1I3VER2_9SPHI|nr:hypothetical protein CLV26_1162 [Parapedobacter indicus]SFJ93662.1 hypothetical protein SAMN05444682_11682 [Parapedobacter indicus]